MVVNATGGFGDASITGTASQYEGQFTAGLAFANNTTYAATDAWVCERAIMDGAMTNVKCLYMNMAWTFPTLTDGLVAQLTTFLNTTGKCMFICGQDIGWETMDAASTYDTPNTQAFYTNYLNATYVNDGPTTAQTINAITTDAIFGTLGANPSTVATYPTFYFPDRVNATGTGVPIFRYGTVTTSSAGVRAFNTNYKVVYLCIGIEQFTNTTSKNNILKTSHDWFWGLSTVEQFDENMAASLGLAYPNPTNDISFIPVSNIDKDMTIQVCDVTGRVVLEQAVAEGTTLIQINTAELNAGMYLYRLVDGNAVIKAKQLQVIH